MVYFVVDGMLLVVVVLLGFVCLIKWLRLILIVVRWDAVLDGVTITAAGGMFAVLLTVSGPTLALSPWEPMFSLSTVDSPCSPSIKAMDIDTKPLISSIIYFWTFFELEQTQP